MKKIYKLLLSILTIFCLAIVCITIVKKVNMQTIVNETNDTKSLKGEVYNLPEDFTCTGLTWDSKDEAFWIADYGRTSTDKQLNPRLVKVDYKINKIIDYIDLSDVLKPDDNLQGISYDANNDSIWIAVGDSCKNISKDGTIIFEFSLGDYAKYKSNGICIDGDSIWVLCYSKYLLKFNKDGSLIDKINFNYKDQDMLTLYKDKLFITVGADYNGDNNFVLCYNPKTNNTTVEYKVLNSYAIEGLTILDGQMYIANDGLFHDAIVKSSYITKYNIEISN